MFSCEFQMKIFIPFSLIFFLFSSGITVPHESKLFHIGKFAGAPHAHNVTINVTWVFTSGANATNVMMTVHNLRASEYAAFGLGQNQTMVNIILFFLHISF